MENNAHIMFLFLNLSHQSHAVLEAFLVCSSHLGGSSFTYDVKELVEGRELFFGQRLFKGVCRACKRNILQGNSY